MDAIREAAIRYVGANYDKEQLEMLLSEETTPHPVHEEPLIQAFIAGHHSRDLEVMGLEHLLRCEKTCSRVIMEVSDERMKELCQRAKISEVIKAAERLYQHKSDESEEMSKIIDYARSAFELGARFAGAK